MGGSAVMLAAEALKEKLREVGAACAGCAAKDIAVDAGLTVSHAGRTFALTELVADGITVESTYANTQHTYSYGTAAAHVAVDPRTGHVRLIDYVVVQDMGRVINPLTANGQLIGALVQGLGGAFLENLQYDEDGNFLSGSLADYLMPGANDFPSLRGIVIENARTPVGLTGGAKGASEGGLISVGGVIGNAVGAALRALGAEPRALPLSPPRVWQLIQEARKT